MFEEIEKTSVFLEPSVQGKVRGVGNWALKCLINQAMES